MPMYTTKLRSLSDRELEDLIDVIGEVLGVDTGEWSGSRMEDAKRSVKQILQAEEVESPTKALKFKCETCGASRTNDEINNCGERRPFLRFSNGTYQSYWPCKRCSSCAVIEVKTEVPA